MKVAKGEPPTEADLFNKRGPAYAEAWRILKDGCEIPSSWEGFEWQLDTARRNTLDAVTPQQVAREIAYSYKRFPQRWDQ